MTKVNVKMMQGPWTICEREFLGLGENVSNCGVLMRGKVKRVYVTEEGMISPVGAKIHYKDDGPLRHLCPTAEIEALSARQENRLAKPLKSLGVCPTIELV